MNMNACELLLHEVQAKSFLAHDLLLYLDTHPDCEAAWCAYQDALDARDKAVCAYEKYRRALTPDGLRNRDCFDWADEPFPWQ